MANSTNPTATTESTGLFVATYRDGDAGGSGAAAWVALAPSDWLALVRDQATAETVASRCGAELLGVAPWDGEPFGDEAWGTVSLARSRVLRLEHGFIAASDFDLTTLPPGWAVDSP
jgi:hypothetical protein